MVKFVLFLFASQKILFNTNGGIYTYSKIIREYVKLMFKHSINIILSFFLTWVASEYGVFEASLIFMLLNISG